MLKDFEYWNGIINDVECDMLKKNCPARLIGYRLGYLTAKIENVYFDNELTDIEYVRLNTRLDDIYLRIKK